MGGPDVPSKPSVNRKNRAGELVVGTLTTWLDPTVKIGREVTGVQFVVGMAVALHNLRFGEFVGQEIAKALVRFVETMVWPVVSEMLVGVTIRPPLNSKAPMSH